MKPGLAIEIIGWKPGKDIEGSSLKDCVKIPEEIASRCYYTGREGLMPWDKGSGYRYFKDPTTGTVYAQKRDGSV